MYQDITMSAASSVVAKKQAAALLSANPCYYIGPKGSPVNYGNVAVVDVVLGDDATASVGGSSFKTLISALSVIQSGNVIWMMPGTHVLTAGIVLPTNVTMYGFSSQLCVLSYQTATVGTTKMLTLNENCRIYNMFITLTSVNPLSSPLIAIDFAGNSTVNCKVIGCLITVDNSSVSTSATTNVYGIYPSGTGGIVGGIVTPSIFLNKCLFQSNINIFSNGAGSKRGIYITTSCAMSIGESNVYVSPPTNTASTGSYVGIETADTNLLGLIQVGGCTIGSCYASTGSFTSSDILQTYPVLILDPSSAAGIQLGSGTNLLTRSAGGRGFTTFVYPTVLQYGLKGTLSSAPAGYLWNGTQLISAGVFPDPGTPAAYFRIQQKCVLCGISCSLNIAPGTGSTVILTVLKTAGGSGTPVATPITVTFGATDLNITLYTYSVNFNTGDRLHVYVSYTGSTAAHDLSVQLDLF